MISSPMRKAQGNATQGRGAKLDQIFLGGQGEIRPHLVGPGGEQADVAGGIQVVIGKNLQVENSRAQRSQGAAKSFGIADAAEGRNLLAGQLVERIGTSFAVNQVDGSVACLD